MNGGKVRIARTVAAIFAIVAVSAGLLMRRISWTGIHGYNVYRSTTNATVNGPDFDSENDGEFNAVDAVESLPETKKLQSEREGDGSGSHLSVVCGAGPDHGRAFWVVNVYIVPREGDGVIVRAYHYNIQTGALTAAAVAP